MVRTVFGQRLYQNKSRFSDEIDKRFTNNDNYEIEKQDYSKNHTKQVSKKSESVVGKMVMHEQMGGGVVIAENENTLTVAFKKCGIKNVMRDFVKFV